MKEKKIEVGVSVWVSPPFSVLITIPAHVVMTTHPQYTTRLHCSRLMDMNINQPLGWLQVESDIVR